jgi:hypothetical protein
MPPAAPLDAVRAGGSIEFSSTPWQAGIGGTLDRRRKPKLEGVYCENIPFWRLGRANVAHIVLVCHGFH